MPNLVVRGARYLRDVDPRSPAHRSDVLFRLDWVPPTGIVVEAPGVTGPLAWMVRGRETDPGFTDHGNHSILIPRIDRPDRIGVQCSAGGQTLSAVIWVLRGQVTVRTAGGISNENQAWRSVAHQLGLGGRNGLGFYTSPRPAAGRTEYGALVEIVGTVEPADVPCRFHLVRRVVAQNNTGVEGRPQGFDDTSHRSLQDQTVSRQGHVFDVDAPGSWFDASDPAGASHSWDTLFEQYLVVGGLPSSPAWRNAESHGLAISPSRTWRARYTARVTAAGRPPTVQLTGSVY